MKDTISDKGEWLGAKDDMDVSERWQESNRNSLVAQPRSPDILSVKYYGTYLQVSLL